MTDDEIKANLKAAGCSAKEIEMLVQKLSKLSCEEKIEVLDVHRKKLLENLHKAENEIDNLDYLTFQLRRNK